MTEEIILFFFLIINYQARCVPSRFNSNVMHAISEVLSFVQHNGKGTLTRRLFHNETRLN